MCLLSQWYYNIVFAKIHQITTKNTAPGSFKYNNVKITAHNMSSFKDF